MLEVAADRLVQWEVGLEVTGVAEVVVLLEAIRGDPAERRCAHAAEHGGENERAARHRGILAQRTQRELPCAPRRRCAMQLGKLGVWTWLDNLSANDAAAFAARVEKWGYGALWIPEAVGRDPFSLLGFLAAKTKSLVLATGIANIYARDALTM